MFIYELKKNIKVEIAVKVELRKLECSRTDRRSVSQSKLGCTLVPREGPLASRLALIRAAETFNPSLFLPAALCDIRCYYLHCRRFRLSHSLVSCFHIDKT